MAAVLLALASSAGWGFSDFIGGLKARRLDILTVLTVSQPVGFVLLTLVVAARGSWPGWGIWILWAGLAGIGGGVGIAALYRGLAVGSMGIVAPITSISPLIPLAVALGRGERPSTVQFIGMALAMSGVALAGYEPGAEGVRGKAAVGAGLALLAAGALGSAQVGIEAASNTDPYWATLVVRMGMCAIILGALCFRRPASGPGSAWPALVFIGCMDSSATILFAVATTKGLFSVVAVLASLYPILVAILARTFLHERLTLVQRSGTLVAIAGAAAISAG